MFKTKTCAQLFSILPENITTIWSYTGQPLTKMTPPPTRPVRPKAGPVVNRREGRTESRREFFEGPIVKGISAFLSIPPLNNPPPLWIPLGPSFRGPWGTGWGRHLGPHSGNNFFDP